MRRAEMPRKCARSCQRSRCASVSRRKASFTSAVACSVCPRRSRPIYIRARRRSSASTSGIKRWSAPSSPSLHARSSSVTAPGDEVVTIFDRSIPHSSEAGEDLFTFWMRVHAFHRADGLCRPRREPAMRIRSLKIALVGIAMTAAAGLVAAPHCLASDEHPNQVLEWNQILIDTLIATNTANSSSQRLSAIVHTAMFDAYNGIERRYTPIHVHDTAPRGASRRAAVIAAAHTTLAVLFPTQVEQLKES